MKTLHKSPATTHKLITNKLITDKSSAQSSASQMANRSGSQVKLWNAKQNWNRSLDDAVRIATRSHVHATSRRGCKMFVEWTSCIKEIDRRGEFFELFWISALRSRISRLSLVESFCSQTAPKLIDFFPLNRESIKFEGPLNLLGLKVWLFSPKDFLDFKANFD